MTTTEKMALLEKIAAQSFALLREIEKRDGEGNIIPDYLYAGLALSLGAASNAGVNLLPKASR